jgi:multisubunit Na+/H+ antiporter MnhB subunit
VLSDGALAIAAHPVVWNALGYQFEAASMIAALSACLIVRIWVWLSDAPGGGRARALNAAITAIAMLFTAGWVMLQRPSPFYALLSGSGFGALGSGIILISLNWVRRLGPIDRAGTSVTNARRPRRVLPHHPVSKKGDSGDGQS